MFRFSPLISSCYIILDRRCHCEHTRHTHTHTMCLGFFVFVYRFRNLLDKCSGKFAHIGCFADVLMSMPILMTMKHLLELPHINTMYIQFWTIFFFCLFEVMFSYFRFSPVFFFFYLLLVLFLFGKFFAVGMIRALYAFVGMILLSSSSSSVLYYICTKISPNRNRWNWIWWATGGFYLFGSLASLFLFHCYFHWLRVCRRNNIYLLYSVYGVYCIRWYTNFFRFY